MQHFAPFLKKTLGEAHSANFLAGDASFRKYYRVQKGSSSFVLMDAPPPENPAQFTFVQNFLYTHGMTVPQIYAQDLDKGLLLLEDFGDQTFTRCLREGVDEKMLYTQAIDTLIALHQKSVPSASLPSYTLSTLLDEITIFLTWYWPYRFSQTPSTETELSFIALWESLYSKALQGPNHVVLRDYHVDNLMWLPDRQGLQKCGLLDFQDALWGPQIYDVVSLLEDARQDVPAPLSNYLWQRYMQAFPKYQQTFELTGPILSAGRHLRILGVFARKKLRDHQNHYLVHEPRLWRWLRHCCQHPALVGLSEWLKEHNFD